MYIFYSNITQNELNSCRKCSLHLLIWALLFPVPDRVNSNLEKMNCSLQSVVFDEP